MSERARDGRVDGGSHWQATTVAHCISASSGPPARSGSSAHPALTLRNASGRAVRMTGLIWDITESSACRAHEERIRRHGLARVAHAAHVDLAARSAWCLAGVAGELPERAAEPGQHGLEQLRAPDAADQRHSRHGKAGIGETALRCASDGCERAGEALAGGQRRLAQSLNVHFVTPEPLCQRSTCWSIPTASCK